MKYNLSTESHYWQCGDGCCDRITEIISINDIEIGGYGDFQDFEGLKKFIQCLNENDTDITLTYSVKLNEYNDYIDVLYLNGVLINTAYWCNELYEDILQALKLSYKFQAYDIVWEKWQKEKKFELELEKEFYVEFK